MELTEIRLKKLGDNFNSQGKISQNEYNDYEQKKTDLVAVMDLVFDNVFIVKSIRVLEKKIDQGNREYMVLYPEAKIKNRYGEQVKVGSAFPIEKEFALSVKNQVINFLKEKEII